MAAGRACRWWCANVADAGESWSDAERGDSLLFVRLGGESASDEEVW
jgi:hypothetical protein